MTNATMVNGTAVNGTAIDPGTDLLLRLYHGIPSDKAAAVVACLFIVITLVSLGITIKTRAWFMMMVPITGVCEFGGYMIRFAMIHSPSIAKFTIQQCLLIIPPILLAVVDYICVGRLLKIGRATADANRLLPQQPHSDHQPDQAMTRGIKGDNGAASSAMTADKARRSSKLGQCLGRTCHHTCCSERLANFVAKMFTASDIFCLILQSAGGGLFASSDPHTQQMGRNLLLIGLLLQMGFFTFFSFLVVYADYSPDIELRGPLGSRKLFFCLYANISLMFIRNIFRVFEFALGFGNPLSTKEVFLYIFDFVPIYCCFILFCVLHFGFFLGGSARGQQSYMCNVPSTDEEAGMGAAPSPQQRTAELVAVGIPQGKVLVMSSVNGYESAQDLHAAARA